MLALNYIYIRSEHRLWTVGFYEPDGTWVPESDHEDKEAAAQRVHWLNGGQGEAEIKTTSRSLVVGPAVVAPRAHLLAVCYRDWSFEAQRWDIDTAGPTHALSQRTVFTKEAGLFRKTACGRIVSAKNGWERVGHGEPSCKQCQRRLAKEMLA